MEKKTHPQIRVETLPNGYALTVDGHEYMYFKIEELIAGFFTRVAVGKTEYLDKETVEGILIAAASWKTVGEAMEANAQLIASARRANYDASIAERGMAKANERAEMAEKELNKLKLDKLCLEGEIFQLKKSIERIGSTLVGKKTKSRVVIEESEKMSRGRQHLITGPKKKSSKGRYARKE